MYIYFRTHYVKNYAAFTVGHCIIDIAVATHFKYRLLGLWGYESWGDIGELNIGICNLSLNIPLTSTLAFLIVSAFG